MVLSWLDIAHAHPNASLTRGAETLNYDGACRLGVLRIPCYSVVLLHALLPLNCGQGVCTPPAAGAAAWDYEDATIITRFVFRLPLMLLSASQVIVADADL